MKGIIKWVKGEDRIETSPNGGIHSKLPYQCDQLPFRAILAMAKTIKEGKKKYPDDDNWKKVSQSDHLNHALFHIFLFLTGDRTEPHLEHALTRLSFAYEVNGALVSKVETSLFDDFVKDRCRLGQDFEVAEDELLKVYSTFCKNHNSIPLPKIIFQKHLINMGCSYHDHHRRSYFRNVALK